MRDANGTVAGMIGIARDITDRKAAIDSIQESEKRYRELTNAIPQIVWTAATDGAITHVNDRAIEYTGLNVASLTGWSWEQIVHPNDLEKAIEEWSLALTTGVPRTFEMRLRGSDGEYRWHICRQLPLRNADGTIGSWVAPARY